MTKDIRGIIRGGAPLGLYISVHNEAPKFSADAFGVPPDLSSRFSSIRSNKLSKYILSPLLDLLGTGLSWGATL